MSWCHIHLMTYSGDECHKCRPVREARELTEKHQRRDEVQRQSRADLDAACAELVGFIRAKMDKGEPTHPVERALVLAYDALQKGEG